MERWRTCNQHCLLLLLLLSLSSSSSAALLPSQSLLNTQALTAAAPSSAWTPPSALPLAVPGAALSASAASATQRADWTRERMGFLICSVAAHAFDIKQKRHLHHTWMDIQAELAAKGLVLSPLQLRSKWQVVFKQYKEDRKRVAVDVSYEPAFPYHQQLHAAFGDDDGDAQQAMHSTGKEEEEEKDEKKVSAAEDDDSADDDVDSEVGAANGYDTHKRIRRSDAFLAHLERMEKIAERDSNTFARFVDLYEKQLATQQRSSQ